MAHSFPTRRSSDLGLVFPNGLGKVESYANLIERGFAPIQHTAGITVLAPVLDDAGKPIISNAGEPVLREVPKYGCTPYATPAPPFGLSRATIRSRYRPSWGIRRSRSPSIPMGTSLPIVKPTSAPPKTFRSGYSACSPRRRRSVESPLDMA